ncbi:MULTISPECIES: AAA family ATPase [unclassified Bradyrhizobium]|uniref:AAA family ATPase n=1 Tax=unclassified Bradyrhizobium TaxID=2631580 RepID=UPI0028E730D4|nr:MULTISPECIES: AAA family ATPase [unclassified Bradyrhizobium]
MRNRTHIREYVQHGTPPRHAANLIIRISIVRALRRSGLHHVLRGKPAFAAFTGAQPELLEVYAREALALLGAVVDHETTYHALFWHREDAGKSPADRDSLRLLSNHSIVLGFASDKEDVPVAFQRIADQIVALDRTDERVLAAAFRAIFRDVPPPQTLSAAADVPIEVLNVYLSSGRTLRQAIDLIERYRSVSPEARKADLTPHPRLQELTGLGDVADWGMSLARDLQEYRDQRLSWADVDRGALVSGPSGTGKTLFARALGNTCGVPVHVHSLARWQAKGHLGELLKAMRRAFDESIKSAPCILFIDEIDAVGNRENFQGANEQYCREVVDALLECLDGLEGREGVVVVAATNYPEKVDPALLRPGRLDRHFSIAPPDLAARSKILRYHLGDHLAGFDLTDIARRLEGATGALIERVVRDARRRARRSGQPMLLEDLERGFPRIRLSEAAFQRACVHEAGHVLVGHLLSAESGSIPTAARVLRETVHSQSDAGQTEFYRIPGFDRSITGHLAEMTTLLAGLAAEDVVLGGHAGGSGGAENSDLHLATVLAAGLESSFGLGNSLVYLVPNDPVEILALVRSDSRLRRQVHAKLKACAQRARVLIGQHRGKLVLIADALAQHSQLTSSDITRLVRGEDSNDVSSNCEDRNRDLVTSLLPEQ